MRVIKLFAYLALAILMPLWLYLVPEKPLASVETANKKLYLDSLTITLVQPQGKDTCTSSEVLLDTLVEISRRNSDLLKAQLEKPFNNNGASSGDIIEYNLSLTKSYQVINVRLKKGQREFILRINNISRKEVATIRIDSLNNYKWNIPPKSSHAIPFNISKDFKKDNIIYNITSKIGADSIEIPIIIGRN